MVLTGTLIIGLLCSNKDAPTEIGIENKNQMIITAHIVPNGMAPEEPAKTKKKFNPKTIANKIPGTKTGVKIMLIFQFSPPKNLYKYPETYEEIALKATNKINMKVDNEPLLDGDNKPNKEKIIVTKLMKRT